MPLNIEECIFFMLAKASQAGSRFWTSRLADLKITSVQAMVLNFLGQQDTVTSRELGVRTGLDGATLTGVLDRLEGAGLIQRQRHPSDRRALHICLTARGYNLVPEIQQRLADANRDFLVALADKEQTALRRMLHTLRSTTTPDNP